MSRAKRAQVLGAGLFAVAAMTGAASAQIRMVSYNIEADIGGFTTPRPGLDTVLQQIGTDSFGGFARPIDILTLQETTSNATTVAPIVTGLNNFYGANTYAMSSYQGTQDGGTGSGNGPNALVYNTHTLQLIASVGVGTPSGSGEPRQEIRYQFRPIGYGSEADFYVYCGHFKSASDLTSENRRLAEARIIRADAATLPAGARIVYTGDYNPFKGSDEPAWQLMLQTGTGTLATNAAIDPINLGNGTWDSDITAFRGQYTDSTTSLHYRDDMQLPNAAAFDGHGFSYITGTYHPFSNTGNISLGGQSPNSNVRSASDHYPVVADWRLPSKQSVAVGGVPSQVITGANVPVNVTVTNSAPVAVAAGADTLSYAVTSAGSLTGSANGTNLAALAAGNVYTLTLNTGGVGTATGTVSVNASSQETASASFSAQVSTQVLDHSQPSFSGAGSVGVATIDFGIKGRGLGGGSASFSVFNNFGAGATAGLDLDSVNGVGSTSQLTTNAGSFTNLSAGNNQNFVASIDASTNGNLTATYTFNVSDQDLPGATTRGPLTLVLKGIIATPGDADLNNKIDGSDYAKIDTTFNNEHSAGNIGGWVNGDFDGNGRVDGSDYALIDVNFNSQNGSLAGALAFLDGSNPQPSDMNTPALQLVVEHFEQFGDDYRNAFFAAVPEPTTGMIVLATMGALLRRRRRRSGIDASR